MRQDIKSLMAQAIILLWRESQIPEHENAGNMAVRSLLEHFPKQEEDVGILTGMKSFVKSLLREPIVLNQSDFIDSVKLICAEDTQTAAVIEEAIKQENDPTALKRMVGSMVKKIHQTNRDFQFKKIIYNAHREIAYGDESKQVSEVAKNIIEQLEPFSVDVGAKDKAILTEVTLDAEESMEKEFEIAEERNDGTRGYITGWADLNEALGGYIREGYTALITALKHNYKTGFTLSLFTDILRLNTPVLYDPNKKPAAVWISLEDEVPDLFYHIYSRLKAIENGGEITESKVSAKERSRYVFSELTKNGWHPIFIRVIPDQWGYIDFQNKIMALEAGGYEIKICATDYLDKMNKNGCTVGVAGDSMRDLLRRMRNYFAIRNTTYLTPHQLSTDATMLLRDGRRELAKLVVGKDYTDGCKRLCQEADIEIAVSIEELDYGAKSPGVDQPERALCVAVGKYKNVYVPKSKKSFVIPFIPNGPIIPDSITGKQSCRTLAQLEDKLMNGNAGEPTADFY